MMNNKKKVKLIQEGSFFAEVDINPIEDETGWSPYLSLEDAVKLDDVRKALQCGDVASAVKLARVYTLTPVL